MAGKHFMRRILRPFTPSATGRHRYLTVNEQQAALIRDRFVSLITGIPKHFSK
jgi:hypothetical protein